MQPLIRLENISKDYRRLRALSNVSLDVTAGITGLLGPNGAGKTTLIKVLMGLVRLTGGTGHVLGYQLGQEARQIRQRVGYMPEDDCYIPGLSGVEMLQFMVRLSGQRSIEGLRRSHEILDYCGMGQERYRDVATYSNGMRQKLKFAQAIGHDPALLILDEPTAGLDPAERQAMLNRIRWLAEEAGKTILVSTHILPDVQEICDHVVVMAQGQIRLAERLAVLNRPASPAIQVRVVGSAAALATRIRNEGFQAVCNDNGTLTISGLDESLAARVWGWARQQGVGVRSLTHAKNSLEEVFLEAIQENGVANP